VIKLTNRTNITNKKLIKKVDTIGNKESFGFLAFLDPSSFPPHTFLNKFFNVIMLNIITFISYLSYFWKHKK